MARKEVRLQLRQPRFRHIRLPSQRQSFLIHSNQKPNPNLPPRRSSRRPNPTRLINNSDVQMALIHLQTIKIA